MKRYNRRCRTDAGHTLFELLIVTVIVGTIAALGAPNWFKYIGEQRLNEANETMETILRTAQNRAKQEGQAYKVDFRTYNNIPQVSMYRKDRTPDSCWTYLNSLGDRKSSQDTCQNFVESQKITLSLTHGASITFNFDGTIAPDSLLQPNEKVTLSLTGVSDSPYRCVRIKTILGSMDRGKDSVQCQQT
jgi:type II secretory pathway pseudopilin PulG